MKALLKTTAAEGKAYTTIRVAGLLVLVGAFLGTTLGVYALLNAFNPLNPWLFYVFIDISQSEVMPFFLGFYLPSFVLIVSIGYVFATTRRLERSDLWHVAPLSVLSLLSVVLSALSPFNILSFIGGFFALIAVILVHTKPAFKTLWKREACFLVEAGSLLVSSSSTLFLLMWLISQFVPTYSVGFAGAGTYYLLALLIMEALSFLAFFIIPSFCSRGAHNGFCGMLGLVAGVAFSLIAIQNQYFYINASTYLGAFLVGAGIALTFSGALIYVKLFISQVASPVVLMPTFIFRGKYCPYCGEPWTDPARTLCSSCGRSLKWRPEVPFCPYCGRLVSRGLQICPHCKEDVGSRPVYYSLRKLEKKEMWAIERESKLQRALRTISDHIPLTLKRFVYVIILTFVFAFVAFISHTRSEPHPILGAYRFLLIHYGFPLEWLEITTTIGYLRGATIVWAALVLDFIMYFLLAFVIVFGIAKFVDYMRE